MLIHILQYFNFFIKTNFNIIFILLVFVISFSSCGFKDKHQKEEVKKEQTVIYTEEKDTRQDSLNALLIEQTDKLISKYKANTAYDTIFYSSPKKFTKIITNKIIAVLIDEIISMERNGNIATITIQDEEIDNLNYLFRLRATGSNLEILHEYDSVFNFKPILLIIYTKECMELGGYCYLINGDIIDLKVTTIGYRLGNSQNKRKMKFESEERGVKQLEIRLYDFDKYNLDYNDLNK